MNYQHLQHTWVDFGQRITAFIDQLGLENLSLYCDHAALRVNDNHMAQLLADEFSQHGKIISNNIINGRPILIIKLTEPLVIGAMHIQCVELPFPSDKAYPVEGWEHVELVFPSQAQTCDELVAELIEKVPQLADIIASNDSENSDIKVKQSSPKGDKERLANPTIAFKANGICVKVHPHDIQKIVESEQAC
ncbi:MULTISPECIES: VOC family protein [Shewanella]|uniref:VOC family protein n=1 Tax=Shewanella psychromarinicola TaxID=2487742 RepID=A0A3N4F0B9_9GAMM|nr:VOC family protein [Shewanella psychromarinicola]AZG36663.1 VOC family protein [Shewanella psychromarinicola]MCL1082328.1 VOC family protein [Shewanella psychromarinicola]RPA34514.1 VOC family protein [Shewanella psychromarinicola]